MSQWQFLCHIRRKWVNVSEEEQHLLDAACNGQRSAEYRLKNGVPMQVDFAAKVRVNLASKRATHLRRVDSGPVACEATELEPCRSGALQYQVQPVAAVESSESEDDGLQQVQEMLPQPVEVLQAEKSREWLLAESHRQRFLRSPHLDGKHKALAETREEQVSLSEYLDACRTHLEGAKTHMEKGRGLYLESEKLGDQPAYESAGKHFALAIAELNKLHALKDLPSTQLPQMDISSLQKEHRKLTSGCFLNLAMCNLKSRHFQEALENSEEALSLDPCCAKALYRKALALEGLGMDALPVWRQALQLQPQDALLRRKLREAVLQAQERRSWERRAFRGALGRGEPGKAERLRGILGRACDFLGVRFGGDLWRICDVLESGGSLESEIQPLDELFAQCVALPREEDLELSMDEVSFLSSLGVSLPSLDGQVRARQLLERLQRGELLQVEEEQFLREEHRKLSS